MNIKMRWLLFATVISVSSVSAQTGYANIEEGKPMKAMTFKNIKYFKKTQASLKDFKGKWLILDFWTEECAACIAAMPALNQLQVKFASDVQFLSVGYDCNGCRIQSLYEKYRAKFNLTMPISFDSAIFKQFELTEFPRIVAVDPKGIVRGITVELDEKDVQNLLTKGKLYKPSVNGFEALGLLKYNRKLPLLSYGNGGEDTAYLYRSTFAKWYKTIPSGVLTNNGLHFDNGQKYEALGFELWQLYTLAYFGRREDAYYPNPEDTAYYCRIWPKPLLLLSDSGLFKGNFAKEMNTFCYAAYVPTGKNISFFRRALKNDLNNYFGFDANVEERKMPYYKLVRFNNGIILKTSGKPKELKLYGLMGFDATNISIVQLVNLLLYKNRHIPIADETGIDYQIDISIKDCLLNDIDQVRKALQQNGLDLILSEKKMKVLVIRDGKSENN